MWWSIEKNGQHIVLQQSLNKDDVIKKIYDTEKKESVERLGPIKKNIYICYLVKYKVHSQVSFFFNQI